MQSMQSGVGYFYSVQWAGLDTGSWGLPNNFWELVTRVSKGFVFAG